ncbi:CHAT domain-containing protein, partial [Fusarium sp. MPI-SDFR-AT-0072]
MTSWAEIKSTSQHLNDVGKYDDAIKILEEFLEAAQGDERLYATAELGTVLTNQGCLKAALEILENILEADAALYPVDHPLCLQLRMQTCRLRPIVKASFNGVLHDASEIHAAFHALEDIGEMSHFTTLTHVIVQISINLAYTALLFMTNDLHDRIPIHNLKDSIAWQLPVFRGLMREGRGREAFAVAQHYIRLLNTSTAQQDGLEDMSFSSAIEMVEVIMASPNTVPVWKAAVVGELLYLRNLVHQPQWERLKGLEMDAVRLFQSAEHNHAVANIKLRQVCTRIAQSFLNLTTELLEEIQGYFHAYEEANALSDYSRAVLLMLSSIPPGQGFDLRVSLLAIYSQLSNMTGAKLEYVVLQVRHISIWLSHSTRSSQVIESARSIDELIGLEDCRWVKGMIANITSNAYNLLSDGDNALKWATIAVDRWGEVFRIERAGASLMVLMAMLNKCNGFRSPGVTEVIDFAEKEVARHLEEGLFLAAFEKMAVLVGSIFIPKGDERGRTCLDKMEECLHHLTGRATPDEVDHCRAQLCQFRGQALMGTEPDHDVPDRRNEYFEQAVALYMKTRNPTNAACARQIQANALYTTFQAREPPSWSILRRCIELSDIAKDVFEALDNTLMLAESARMCAFFQFKAWSHGFVSGDTALAALRKAEQASADRRGEVSILASFEAVSRKQRFVTVSGIEDTYARALVICQREGRMADLWDWTQRAKARSVGDQLTDQFPIPATLHDDIMRDPEMKALCEEEESVTQQVAIADPVARLKLRSDLHIIHSKMAGYPIFKQVLDLRKSTPVSISQMRDLGRKMKCNAGEMEVVFVDWISLGGTIWTVALKEDLPPQAVNCSITVEEVKAWKRRWLNAQEGPASFFVDDEYDEDEPEYCLRSIDKLVASLRNLTSEGDLLVFCPTSVLHSIPLHALWIENDTPVIQRNPIIYSASLTTFWQCSRRSELTGSISTDLGWNMAGVYESRNDRIFSSEHETEQLNVYSTLDHLAELYGGTAITGQAVTTESFKHMMENSIIFHFHGHCRLDQPTLGDQSLELADELLPVRKVFEMKLRNPHITLVACDSALQVISPGDEPLGMVTALLCSGASSVLGTIWPTLSSTGRDFSDEFYSDVANQYRQLRQRGSSSPSVNLAEALRRAVLALRTRRKTRQPYHWAAFVLHGSSSIRLP